MKIERVIRPVNALKQFDLRATAGLKQTMYHAESLAERGGNRRIGLEHLTAALLKEKSIMGMLKGLGVDDVLVGVRVHEDLDVKPKIEQTRLIYQYNTSLGLRSLLQLTLRQTKDRDVLPIDVLKTLVTIAPNILTRCFTVEELQKIQYLF